MVLPIITHYENRAEFLASLNNNPGAIIVKFGADWCGPCKIIEDDVHHYFNSMPDTVQCAIIDVDKSFDLFAFLKSKKIIKGIPTLLCYYKGNVHYAPDDVVVGVDLVELKLFMERCLDAVHYTDQKEK